MRATMILVVLAALAASGCEKWGPVAERKGLFIGHSSSPDNAAFFVNDGPNPFPIPANGTAKYMVEIPVPKNPHYPGTFGTPTGPSLNDKVVQVFVAVKNLRTGKLFPSMRCYAGAKVTTNVEYIVDEWGRESTTCANTQPY